LCLYDLCLRLGRCPWHHTSSWACQPVVIWYLILYFTVSRYFPWLFSWGLGAWKNQRCSSCVLLAHKDQNEESLRFCTMLHPVLRCPEAGVSLSHLNVCMSLCRSRSPSRPQDPGISVQPSRGVGVLVCGLLRPGPSSVTRLQFFIKMPVIRAARFPSASVALSHVATCKRVPSSFIMSFFPGNV